MPGISGANQESGGNFILDFPISFNNVKTNTYKDKSKLFVIGSYDNLTDWL